VKQKATSDPSGKTEMEVRAGVHGTRSPERLYLDLLKQILTRYMFGETHRPVQPAKGTWQRGLYLPIKKLLGRLGLTLVRRYPFDPLARAEGRDWPPEAETMIGLKRLDNLEYCITDVLERDVPGDLIETGVWRGGAAIFMRGVLEARGESERLVWAADSFQGLPEPGSSAHPTDHDYELWTRPQLAASLEDVRANFARYGLLDDRVRFIVGWFEKSLPAAPIQQLAVLRLDGDYYSSTIAALEALYPKVSVGGYVIVDDYYALRGCKIAVDEFRERHGITEEMEVVDWSCVYWRRST
jgi:O-methyltransferase